MKYLIRHWINVDMVAEEIVDGKGIDFKTQGYIRTHF